MWSCSQFRAFLHQQGRAADWDAVTVPGMQKAIIRALQTAQEQVEPRKGSFELYGADFMLGRDLRPWLLEINICPTMAQSSAATAHLCPAVQIDTLRVVLDRRSDPSAPTGGFQLICKQVGARWGCRRGPSVVGECVYGRQVDVFCASRFRLRSLILWESPWQWKEPPYGHREHADRSSSPACPIPTCRHTSLGNSTDHPVRSPPKFLTRVSRARRERVRKREETKRGRRHPQLRREDRSKVQEIRRLPARSRPFASPFMSGRRADRKEAPRVWVSAPVKQL